MFASPGKPGSASELLDDARAKYSKEWLLEILRQVSSLSIQNERENLLEACQATTEDCFRSLVKHLIVLDHLLEILGTRQSKLLCEVPGRLARRRSPPSSQYQRGDTLALDVQQLHR